MPSPASRRKCSVSSSRASPRPCAARADRDREDFRLVLDQPRHDEAGERASGERAVRDHVPVEQQAVDFLLAPAALERGGVQRGDRGGVAALGFGQLRLAAAEQIGEKLDHRRGNWPASCGWASGARR